ncbi:hypothetical protein ACFXPY_01890, partial [Streptomyces sp. NPDC059153]
MSKLTDVPKRILIGRALRSDRLGETLLPKRIALPVFASDALSSVAYAPGEVLLVLSVAGVSAYHFSPWIALAVVVVMFTVVASYRQNVHAYPSGGGGGAGGPPPPPPPPPRPAAPARPGGEARRRR